MSHATGSKPTEDTALGRITPRSVGCFLSGCIAFFVLMNLVQNAFVYVTGGQVLGRVTRLFDTNQEHNFPTVYSACVLALAGLLLESVARLHARMGRSRVAYWRGLAFIFAYLALDEICMLHELVNVPLRGALGTSGFLFFAWVIPGSIAVLVLMIVFARWFMALPRRTRLLGFVSAGAYVTGALILEMVAAGISSTNNDARTLPYLTFAAIEEALEMSGVALWVFALVDYIARLDPPAPALGVRVEPDRA